MTPRYRVGTSFFVHSVNAEIYANETGQKIEILPVPKTPTQWAALWMAIWAIFLPF